MSGTGYRWAGFLVRAAGLIFAFSASLSARADIVSYAFSDGFVTQDTGGVYAPGTPISGALAYVTGAPIIQTDPTYTLYGSTASFPFYVSLTIGPDNFTYLDPNLATMKITDGGGVDRFGMQLFDPGNIANFIQLTGDDFNGTIFSSQAMPTSLDFTQFEQMNFQFSRAPSGGGVVGHVLGRINQFSFSPAPTPPGVPEPGTAVLLGIAILTSLKRCRPA